MESNKGLKAPRKLCSNGSFLKFVSNIEIRILFADVILNFQVVCMYAKCLRANSYSKCSCAIPRGLFTTGNPFWGQNYLELVQGGICGL